MSTCIFKTRSPCQGLLRVSATRELQIPRDIEFHNLSIFLYSMPSRSNAAQLSRRLHSSRLIATSICPLCSFTQSSKFPRAKISSNSPRGLRCASTLVSTTAINANKEIPTRLKNLYTALDNVRRHAPSYVSPSRLQLAQQGLSSERPVSRIAGQTHLPRAM